MIAVSAQAQAVVGRIVGVSDGDTVTVLLGEHDQLKVRLAGIDAPEKGQGFGDRSKAGLSAILFNRQVEVVGNKHDRYGRTVAKIMLANPTCVTPSCPKDLDAGLLQLKSGMAWWYRQYSREQTPKDREAYERAEASARSETLGLWADKSPTPPWEWRKARRSGY